MVKLIKDIIPIAMALAFFHYCVPPARARMALVPSCCFKNVSN